MCVSAMRIKDNKDRKKRLALHFIFTLVYLMRITWASSAHPWNNSTSLVCKPSTWPSRVRIVAFRETWVADSVHLQRFHILVLVTLRPAVLNVAIKYSTLEGSHWTSRLCVLVLDNAALPPGTSVASGLRTLWSATSGPRSCPLVSSRITSSCFASCAHVFPRYR